MNKFVLDCSIAVSWLFEDEADAFSDQLLQMLKNGEAWVPTLWHLEVTNVLVQASRRNRIKEKEIPSRLELLSSLPIKTDSETPHRAFNSTFHLALEGNLSSYDASYLELAIRRNIAIATKDEKLKQAMKKMKVPLLN